MDGKLKAAAIVILGGLLACLCVSAQILNVIIGTSGSGSGPAAFTFYVSQSTGSDSNPGTQAQPFQTIAKVNALSLTAGQSVGFMRGDTWRERLSPSVSGSAASQITFGAYGAGAKPVISAAVSFSPGTWTEVQGGGASSDLLYANFDDGDFSAWVKSGTWTATSGGAQAAITSANKTPLLAKSIAAGSEVWYQYNLTVSGDTSVTTNIIQGAGLRDGGGVKDIFLGYANVSGVLLWRYTYQTNSAQTQANSAVSITQGTNYLMTVHWKKATGAGTNDGIVQIWAGTTSVVNLTNIANDTLNNPTQVTLGNNSQTGTFNTTLLFDNVAVGDAGTAPTSAASSNVWSATYSPADSNPLVATIDGTLGYPQQSTFGLSVGNTWMYQSGAFYVYATSTPVYAIEIGSREEVLQVTQSYLTFQNLDIRNGNIYGIHLSGAQTGNKFISDDLSNSGLFNFVPQSGDTISSISIINCSSSHAGGFGITFNNKSGWLISGNTSSRDGILAFSYEPSGYGGTNLKWGGGIKGFGPTFGDNIFENNTVSFSGIREDGYKPDPVNHGYGIWLDTLTPSSAAHANIVRNNVVHDNVTSGLFSEKTSFAEWYGNISYNNGEAGLRVGSDVGSLPVTSNLFAINTLYNNTLFGIEVYGVTGGAPGVIVNNTFQDNLAIPSTGGAALSAIWGGENDGVNGSGNVYTYDGFGPQAASFVQWGSGVFESTYATWEAASGNCGVTGCSNSVQSDPEFVDPSSGNFNLQTGSPARNTGTCITGITQCPTNVGAK